MPIPRVMVDFCQKKGCQNEAVPGKLYCSRECSPLGHMMKKEYGKTKELPEEPDARLICGCPAYNDRICRAFRVRRRLSEKERGCACVCHQ